MLDDFRAVPARNSGKTMRFYRCFPLLCDNRENAAKWLETGGKFAD